VPPATVFLGSIFAMFLVFAFVGGPGFVKQNTETTADRISASSDRMTTALEDLKEARADLKLAREQLAAEKAKPIAEQNPVIVRN